MLYVLVLGGKEASRACGVIGLDRFAAEDYY
jgi:hypothetical protein